MNSGDAGLEGRSEVEVNGSPLPQILKAPLLAIIYLPDPVPEDSILLSSL